MNHLETLIFEWLDYKGHVVRRNVKVGPLNHGGYECELDVVAYDPIANKLLHIEPSLDAHTWEVREKRFDKKFSAGKKYIFSEVFPWLNQKNVSLEQWAVIYASDKNHSTLGGGKLIPLKGLITTIVSEVGALGQLGGNAIPEQYPLLRTIQLCNLVDD